MPNTTTGTSTLNPRAKTGRHNAHNKHSIKIKQRRSFDQVTAPSDGPQIKTPEQPTPNRSATGIQRQVDRQPQHEREKEIVKHRDATQNNGRGTFALPRRRSRRRRRRRPPHFLPLQSHSHGSSFQQENRGIVDRSLPLPSLSAPGRPPCAYYALSVACAGRRKKSWSIEGQQVDVM
jgi:hypothetical protein